MNLEWTTSPFTKENNTQDPEQIASIESLEADWYVTWFYLIDLFSNMSKAFVRSIKNVANGYSSAQVKVRNGEFLPNWMLSVKEHWITDGFVATSNEPYGPSTSEMEDIADMTYEQ